MSRQEDRAIDLQDGILSMQINSIRSTLYNTGNPSGLCWSCDAKIGNERRFCDKDCRDDWQILHER